MSHCNNQTIMAKGIVNNAISRQQVIMSSASGVTVPLKFSGIQNTAYPFTYTTAPNAPNLTCTSSRERNHDIGGQCGQWLNINTSAGVYDATKVARLDAWIDQCYADGREVIFALYGTPSWIASTTINFSDQYGRQYAANHPSDTGVNGSAALNTFVTWVMNRYNSGVVKKDSLLGDME